MVLSVKSEKWNGEYVELQSDMVMESNLVVSLSVDAKTSAHEVILCSHFVYIVSLGSFIVENVVLVAMVSIASG